MPDDRYALVNPDGDVVNVVRWDGGEGWAPPEGLQPILVEEDAQAEPGGTYIDEKFEPAPVVEVPTVDDVRERLLKFRAIRQPTAEQLGDALEDVLTFLGIV